MGFFSPSFSVGKPLKRSSVDKAASAAPKDAKKLKTVTFDVPEPVSNVAVVGVSVEPAAVLNAVPLPVLAAVAAAAAPPAKPAATGPIKPHVEKYNLKRNVNTWMFPDDHSPFTLENIWYFDRRFRPSMVFQHMRTMSIEFQDSTVQIQAQLVEILSRSMVRTDDDEVEIDLTNYKNEDLWELWDTCPKLNTPSKMADLFEYYKKLLVDNFPPSSEFEGRRPALQAYIWRLFPHARPEMNADVCKLVSDTILRLFDDEVDEIEAQRKTSSSFFFRIRSILETFFVISCNQNVYDLVEHLGNPSYTYPSSTMNWMLFDACVSEHKGINRVDAGCVRIDNTPAMMKRLSDDTKRLFYAHMMEHDAPHELSSASENSSDDDDDDDAEEVAQGGAAALPYPSLTSERAAEPRLGG
jgi:hypothetical protein